MPEERHLIAPRSKVSQDMREKRQGHGGMVFWLTGLSGAGKSTLAHEAEERLFALGCNVVVFDGDAIRKGLCKDLGFSPRERQENNRRIAEVAKLFVRAGCICICAFISPARKHREEARAAIGAAFFKEVFVNCPENVCEYRDVKGFYAKARQGLIKNYTGVSAAYEPPEQPDCAIHTSEKSILACADELTAFILVTLGKNCVGLCPTPRKGPQAP